MAPNDPSTGQALLYEPARHEALLPLRWNEAEVRAAIERIVADTEARFSETGYWPLHPLDFEPGDDPSQPATTLYDGACGVFWALHHLGAIGAARLSRSYFGELDRLLVRNGRWLAARGYEAASYLSGETPIRMLAYGAEPSDGHADALAALVAGNVAHPARELMYGAPGTLLAALFLHERTGAARWAELFRASARALWAALEWSPTHACAYWSQDLSGRRSTYLDAVHGFVATALPLIRGRRLLAPDEWEAWQRCIVNTVERTADRHGTHVNWRPQLEDSSASQKRLLQFCHGAPGFLICLAGLPDRGLDDLLVGGGETIWAAGPLAKGSNLCHGTGGNGYGLLALYERTGDLRWLERARAFAMHGIAQTWQHAERYGQLRYSLWTGDVGFAIYLADCLRGAARFPTLDVFYAAASAATPATTH